MDDDSSFYVPYREPQPDCAPGIAYATIEQIRYAEQLRLRIRESYLSRAEPPPSLWTVHVD